MMSEHGMTPQDDVQHWADVAAEELARALSATGIGFIGTSGDEDGTVEVAFSSLADAEALMTLAVGSDDVLGGLYDRSTSSCMTLSDQVARDGDDVDVEDAAAAIRAGWVWNVHPAMRGRVMGWHVMVEVPAADANQLTATLNGLRNSGF